MASVSGGQHGSGSQHASGGQLVNAGVLGKVQAAVLQGATAGTQHAASSHEVLLPGGHYLVDSATTARGVDVTVGGTHGVVTFAGKTEGSVEKVVATQTVHQGGVTLNFHDGSTLTVIGATHLGHFFGH